MTVKGAPRTGLGRGLSALLPDDGDSGSAFQYASVDDIDPNPRQPRTNFDEEAIAVLADSIRRLGVLQPLLCRRVGMRLELIAGERRLRASKAAGLTEVPVIVRESGEENSLEEALLENIHRENLNPLEEAAAYRQLIEDFGLTHDAVSGRVGRSRTAITNTLRLLQLPGELQQLLVEGALTGGHARALLAVTDEDLQKSLATRIVEEGWSVRQTEDEVRRIQNSSERSNRPKAASHTHPALLEVGDLMGEFLDTRVEVKMGQGSGRMVIEFGSLGDLERIAQLILGDVQAGA